MAQQQPRSKNTAVKKETEDTCVVASFDIHETVPVNGKAAQRTVLHDGTIREDF